MGLFNNLWPFGSLSSTPLSSTDTAAGSTVSLTPAQAAEMFTPLNFGGYYTRYGLCTISELRLAFRLCSPLQAIVTQKAFAFTKGMVNVWNPENEKPVRGQYKEWQSLFRNPNPFQSERRFFNQAYTYLQQFGYCVIEPVYAVGHGDRPAELHVIPNWMIEWEVTGQIDFRFSQRPQKAWISYNGVRKPLNVEKLIIIRDSASNEFDETTLLPISRAACLEQEVSNIVASLNATGEMITDRGAMGIMTNEAKDVIGAMPTDKAEVDRIQAMYRRYGITTGKDKIIITSQALKYQALTFDAKELGLSEASISALKSICNRYGFPFTALAEGFEGKYNNSSNGRRDFQDVTIDPEATDFFEQLSQQLGMYKDSCEAWMDYTHVASLQASQEETGKGEQALAQALETQWNLGTVTRNEIREALNREKVTSLPDEFDKYKFETASALAVQENMNQGQPANEKVNGTNTN